MTPADVQKLSNTSTDATSAIQGLMDGFQNVPAGRYVTTKPLIVRDGYLNRLVGDGSWRTAILYTGTDSAIKLFATNLAGDLDSPEIRGIEILAAKGKAIALDASVRSAIRHPLLEDIRIKAAGDTAIDLNPATVEPLYAPTFRQIKIYDFGRQAVRLRCRIGTIDGLHVTATRTPKLKVPDGEALVTLIGQCALSQTWVEPDAAAFAKPVATYAFIGPGGFDYAGNNWHEHGMRGVASVIVDGCELNAPRFFFLSQGAEMLLKNGARVTVGSIDTACVKSDGTGTLIVGGKTVPLRK